MFDHHTVQSAPFSSVGGRLTNFQFELLKLLKGMHSTKFHIFLRSHLCAHDMERKLKLEQLFSAAHTTCSVTVSEASNQTSIPEVAYGSTKQSVMKHFKIFTWEDFAQLIQ